MCGIVTRGTDATFGYFGPRLSRGEHESYKRLYNKGFISNSGGRSAIGEFQDLSAFEKANLGTNNAYLIVAGTGGARSYGLDLRSKTNAAALGALLRGGTAEPLLAAVGGTASKPAEEAAPAAPAKHPKEDEFVGQLSKEIGRAVQSYKARSAAQSTVPARGDAALTSTIEAEARMLFQEKLHGGTKPYLPASVAWLVETYRSFEAQQKASGPGDAAVQASREQLEMRIALVGNMVPHLLPELTQKIGAVESALRKLTQAK